MWMPAKAIQQDEALAKQFGLDEHKLESKEASILAKATATLDETIFISLLCDKEVKASIRQARVQEVFKKLREAEDRLGVGPESIQKRARLLQP